MQHQNDRTKHMTIAYDLALNDNGKMKGLHQTGRKQDNFLINLMIL
jgi:hypothetical protein